MSNKIRNLIALDMDGVINSNQLIRQWIYNKIDELKKDSTKTYDQRKNEAVKLFKKQFCNSQELIFPELAKYIVQICEQTDAYILWTSSWRTLPTYRSNFDNIINMFNKRGLPGNRVIGVTPTLDIYDSNIRGSLINMWLKNNDVIPYNELHKCAVIDDRWDAGEMLPDKAKFFSIDPNQGITEYQTNKIIKYLNSDSN